MGFRTDVNKAITAETLELKEVENTEIDYDKIIKTKNNILGKSILRILKKYEKK